MARKPKSTKPIDTAAVSVGPEIPALNEAPARRGRKPKTLLVAAEVISSSDDAKPGSGRRGRKNRQAEQEAELAPAESETPDEALMFAESAMPPADEVPAPVRRGRKPKASASPLKTAPDIESSSEPAVSEKADEIEAPIEKRRGRKPKELSVAALPKDSGKTASGRRGRKPRLTEQAAELGAAEDASPINRAANGTGADPVEQDATPIPEALGAGGAAKSLSAAAWDRTTDTVRFDWPAIEAVASQDGPNQGMAKLLLAARAEGAGSRWPL